MKGLPQVPLSNPSRGSRRTLVFRTLMGKERAEDGHGTISISFGAGRRLHRIAGVLRIAGIFLRIPTLETADAISFGEIAGDPHVTGYRLRAPGRNSDRIVHEGFRKRSLDGWDL